jgi:polar amino acid transport system substrate-binding protein
MSTFRILKYAVLLSLFSLFAGPVSAQTPKTVTFATDSEKADGFLLALTTEAFKRVGYQTRVEFAPWARAVDMATKGEVDGLLGCYYSDERAKVLTYSDLLAESPMVFFALDKSKINYAKLEDLAKFTIGTINGAGYPKDFAEASFLKKEPVNDFVLNVRKLGAGRIDLFVEKKFLVSSYLAANPSPDNSHIVALDQPLTINKFYNAFSKASPSAAEKIGDFNRGLKILKEDGGFAAIMSKNLHE